MTTTYQYTYRGLDITVTVGDVNTLSRISYLKNGNTICHAILECILSKVNKKMMGWYRTTITDIGNEVLVSSTVEVDASRPEYWGAYAALTSNGSTAESIEKFQINATLGNVFQDPTAGCFDSSGNFVPPTEPLT